MNYDYSIIKNLPSRFVPYGGKDKVDIRIRAFTFGEVQFIEENRSDPASILTMIRDNQVVKTDGMDFFDLTINDWSYIELMLASVSYDNPSYNISAGTCPKCGDEPKLLVVKGLTGEDIEIEQLAELKATITPQEFMFDELEENIGLPIELSIDGSDYIMDFFRIRHLINITKTNPDKLDDNLYRLAEMIDGMSYEDIKTLPMDIGLELQEVVSMLNHGLNTIVPVTCTVCGSKYEVSTGWEVLQNIPFRKSKKSKRISVRFGNARKSTNVPSNEDEVHGRASDVPSNDKTSGRDTERERKSNEMMSTMEINTITNEEIERRRIEKEISASEHNRGVEELGKMFTKVMEQ